ncbi:unnamed protein product [Prunus armeniaca]
MLVSGALCLVSGLLPQISPIAILSPLFIGCPPIGSCFPHLGVQVFTTLVELEILMLTITHTPFLLARFGFIYWLLRQSRKARNLVHRGICVELRHRYGSDACTTSFQSHGPVSLALGLLL